MRRSLDWVIDRYLSVPPPTKLRSSRGRVPTKHSICEFQIGRSERDRLGIVKKIKVLSMQYFVVYLKNCK